MECTNCGTQNTRAQATCTKCGATLADQEPQATQEAQARVPAYKNAANPESQNIDKDHDTSQDKSEYIKGDRSSRSASLGGRQPSSAPNQSFQNQSPGSTQAGPMEAPAPSNPHKERSGDE